MPYSSNYTGAQIDELTVKTDFIDLIYPVGSIYLSVNSTSPATLFGGTWTQIKQKFLLGSGQIGENDVDTFGIPYDQLTSYNLGDTGGELTHTITENEIPYHNHTTPGLHYDIGRESSVYLALQSDGNFVIYKQTGANYTDRSPSWYTGAPSGSPTAHQRGIAMRDNGTTSSSTTNTSGTATGTGVDNNMPPYLAVYMWERTA